MNINCRFIHFLLKKTSFFAVGVLLVCCNSANAVLITFNELDENSYVDANGERTPLTNEYESQGVVFFGPAYVGGGVGGPGFSFEFVGDSLPTYVSFNVSPVSGIAASIYVQGPDYHKLVRSSGAIVGMTDDPGTPPIPNELFSFSSPAGISSVELSGKAGVYFDNLTYTYPSPAQVPEPATFILFGIGLLGLISSRSKFPFRK
jgi:hypothetical protein